MKTVVLSLFAILSCTTFASHFFSCDVETKVLEVKNLARLDGVAVFARRGSDYEQTVVLEVTSITNADRRGCIPVHSKVELFVEAKNHDKFKKGDVVNFEYMNIGDASGSRQTWTLK